MKVEVLKAFKDIHTKHLYMAGSVIEVSEERYREIEKNLKPGFIKTVPAEPAPAK